MLHLLREQTMRWRVLLGVCEWALFTLALVLATYVRYWHVPEDLALHSQFLYVRAVSFGAIMVGALGALGLYQPRMRERWTGLLARQAIAFALGWIATGLIYYMVQKFDVGRGVLGLALLVSFPLIVGFRTLFLQLIDVDALKRRVLVLGSGRRAALIEHRMRRRVDRQRFVVVGFLSLAGERPAIEDRHLLSAPAGLLDCAKRLQINEIVVGPDDRRGQLPMDELLECKEAGVVITPLSSFFERESGRVQLSLTDPSWLLFSGGFDTTPLRRLTKRAFDLMSAATVLAMTWPLMLLTVLAIRLESSAGAPILYRQERIGERGRPFRLIKFRSMQTDAEQDGVARWATKNDTRVTRVGSFIRKVRLDELPQLWNVLRGDMSFVGPRPERPAFVDRLAGRIRYYRMRHCVKPGLTGWAQLNYPYGASEEDAIEKLKYDLFYVKNQNMLLDVIILVQTVEVVLFRRGAR